jgi:hypothetical protein
MSNKTEVQTAYDALRHQEHIHKFVIPVEWQNFGSSEYNGSGYNTVVTGSKVTKLMCECGEEKNRGDN